MRELRMKWSGVWGVLLCFACVAFLALPGAEAYKQISTPNGSGVKWSQVPVTWYYNHNGFQQGSAQQILAVFQASFQKWETPACTALRFTFGGTTTSSWNQSDRRNVLIWNANIPDPNFPNALALTIPAYLNATGEYLDSDIIFNGSYPWSTQPSSQQYDVEGTATHEIGHLLGLDHTQASGATMFPTASPGVCPCRTLKQDDINGVCAIYPSGSSSGGNRQYGQACDAQNLCTTGLVCVLLQQGATTGICFRSCTNGVCPSGDTCYSLSNGQNACLCTADKDCSQGLKCSQNQCQQGGSNPTNSQKLGEACNAQNLCVQGLTCVVTQQGSTSGTCHQTCPNGTCADGSKCYDLNNGEKACLCLNNQDCGNGQQCQGNFCKGGSTGPAGKEGQACVGGQCETGLTCLQDPNSPQSLCVRPCKADTDCVNQWRCNTQYSVCVPGAGTQQRGQPCDNQNRCVDGHVCTLVQQGATTGICILACPQGTCPTGEQCVQAQSGEKLCLCGPQNPCAGGKTCQELRCVDGGSTACQSNNDCPQGQICRNGACAAGCQSNTDCAVGETCQAGQCQPGNSGGCQSSAECAQGQICQNGQCVARGCLANTECAQGQVCQNGQCVASGGCQTSAECAQGQICLSGSCVSDSGSSACNPACTSGSICHNGSCIFAKPCKTAQECNISESCVEDFCRPTKSTLPDKPSQPDPGNDAGCSCQASAAGFPSLLWLLLLLPVVGWRRRFSGVRVS